MKSITLTQLVLVALYAAASLAAASEGTAVSKPPPAVNLPVLQEWDALNEAKRTDELRTQLVGNLARDRVQLPLYLQLIAKPELAAAPSTELVMDAVAQLQDKTAIPVLTQVALGSTNYILRQKAYAALVIGDSSLIPILLPAIDTTDADRKHLREHHQTLNVAVATITALAQSFDGHKILIDTLTEMLPKASDPFKVRAITVLRHVETRESEELMLGLLKDPAALVRYNAISSLGYSGQGRAPDALAEVLRTTDDVNLRKGVVVALGRYKHLGSLDVLLPLLDSTESGLKKDATYAVRNITGREFQTASEAKVWLKNARDSAQTEFDEMAAVAKSNAIEAAAVAIEKLSEQVLLRGKVVDLLIPLMNHGNHRIRGACCFTLGRTGELRTYGYLVERLRDPSPEVSYTAWRALKYTTGRDFPRDFGTWRAWLDKRN